MRSAKLALACVWLWALLDSVGGRREGPDDQVIGGEPAGIQEFPFMVLVHMHQEINRTHTFDENCGGTIINRRHVLTATHCVVRKPIKEPFKLLPTKDVIISLGCYNYNLCMRNLTVTKIFSYRPYGPHHVNDIAILRVADEIEYKRETETERGIEPITVAVDVSECPIRDRQNATSTTRKPRGRASPYLYDWGMPPFLTLVGWGNTAANPAAGHNYPDKLHKVSLPVVPYETCRTRYHWLNQRQAICAGDIKRSQSFGDSGGPLLRDMGGIWQQVGVGSRQSQGAPQKEGGVFTRVAHFGWWIWACIVDNPLCLKFAAVSDSKGYHKPTHTPELRSHRG